MASFSGRRRNSPLKGTRAPAHLKGREIGLWYAAKNRLKREKLEENPDYRKKTRTKKLGNIMVSADKQDEIETLLLSAQYDKNLNDLNFSKEFLAIKDGDVSNKFSFDITPQIHRDTFLDQQLKQDLEDKMKNCKRYAKFLKVREQLPSYAKTVEILEIIWDNQVTLISGETGCGKTTQIPQYILDKCILEGNGSVTKIICTQPRRISAISVSERVADERIEKIGENSIGYHIRLEKSLPRNYGSITFCTTGILLKQMETDPYLTNVSHVILDEIHERNTLCDFVIALLKDLITKRKDLKLILMSATFNSESFAKYFNNKCGQIKIPGFTYPVKEYYLEDVLKLTRHEFTLKFRNKSDEDKKDYINFIEPYIRQVEGFKKYPHYVCKELRNPNSEEIDFDLIKKLIIDICHAEPGAILVFLPGFADIHKLYSLLIDSNKFPSYKYRVIPLHSKLPSAQQRIIFEEPPEGIRKIIISTNIAETSVTINDIVYVIDCGKIKLKNYDALRNLDSLKPEWVSQANADQRKGRAGRVRPGICYHLFSKVRKMILQPQQKPEILRERLESVILQIKILKLGNAELFLSKVMDPPLPEAVRKSVEILKDMNALDDNEKLTPLGYHLAKLPMSPQMGKMLILGTLFSCLDPVLSVAASLDFKDAFQSPLGKENEAKYAKKQLCEGYYSDHLVLHEALKQYVKAKLRRQERQFCWDHYLNLNTLNLLQDMKKQLAGYLYEMQFISDSNYSSQKWNINSQNKMLIKAVIAGALYPNVAVVNKCTPRYKNIVTIDEENVFIVRSSVNESEPSFPSPLLIYYLKLQSLNKIWLHDTSVVYPLSLLFFGKNILIKNSDEGTMIGLDTKYPINFTCNQSVANLLVNIRKKFNDFLEYKVGNPGVVDWTQGNEVNILRAIMELITDDTGLDTRSYSRKYPRYHDRDASL